MAIYTLGVRCINNGTATPACELRATSANKPRLIELSFSQSDLPVAAGVYGLGRPTAVGLNPTPATSELDEQDGNSGSNALASLATAWGTAPTAPTNFMRRVTCGTGIGIGALWFFPRGISLPVSGSLVLWNIATSTPALLDTWWAVDE